jgi:deazaflavin-dependent oxidoreductase (nitroreductase family)
MTQTKKASWFNRWRNLLITPLPHAGVKLVGPGRYPLYLLTVRGRKSGQPRTIPIAQMEQQGKRYLAATYGIVDWVRNLRKAQEAILMRGRRAETVTARELSKREAALELQAKIKRTPLARYMAARFYGVTADTPLELCEQAMLTHPIFVLERSATTHQFPGGRREGRPDHLEAGALRKRELVDRWRWENEKSLAASDLREGGSGSPFSW